MTVAEFNEGLRADVRRLLPACSGVVRGALGLNKDGRYQPERLVTDIAGLMQEAGLMQGRDRVRVNQLAIALYRSKKLEDHMARTSEDIFVKNPALVDTISRLAAAPDTVSKSDYDAAMTVLLADDRLLSGPLQVMLEDEDIRRSLGTDKAIDVAYVQAEMRKAIAESTTWQELLERCNTNPVLSTFACSPTPCIAVIVAVTVAAVVSSVVVIISQATFVVAADTVFTARGSCNDSIGRSLMIKTQGEKPSAVVTNETNGVLWVLVEGFRSVKRCPLMPGESSLGFGVMNPLALLLDGIEVRLPDGHVAKTGVVNLRGTIEQPALVSISGTNGDLILSASEGGWTLDESSPYNLGTAAALVPAGYDLVRAEVEQHSIQRYHRTMRFINQIEAISKDTTE